MEDDVLLLLFREGTMGTVALRSRMGIYPRKLLNKLLLPTGQVRKFSLSKRVMWSLSKAGIDTMKDSMRREKSLNSSENMVIIDNSPVVAIGNEFTKTIVKEIVKEPIRKKSKWITRKIKRD